jgi:hypothetical protein
MLRSIVWTRRVQPPLAAVLRPGATSASPTPTKRPPPASSLSGERLHRLHRAAPSSRCSRSLQPRRLPTLISNQVPGIQGSVDSIMSSHLFFARKSSLPFVPYSPCSPQSALPLTLALSLFRIPVLSFHIHFSLERDSLPRWLRKVSSSVHSFNRCIQPFHLLDYHEHRLECYSRSDY